MFTMSAPSDPNHRRTFLLGAVALVVGACTSSSESEAGGAASSSTTSDSSAAPTTGASTGETDAPTTEAGTVDAADGELEPLTPEMFAAVATCSLTPTSTAGPFPTAAPLDRRAIHEGLPGHPLRLGLRVVDAACAPVPNAVVDIWHTDATGDYSEYEDNGSGKDEGPGSTFCRGQQAADANGIAEFETIYPGWYEGRAVHIHVKVMVDGEAVFTGQLYFDEAYTNAVYQTGEYAQFGPPDTPWSSDRIVGDPASDGTGLLLAEAVTGIGPGTLGLVDLGVPR